MFCLVGFADVCSWHVASAPIHRNLWRVINAALGDVSLALNADDLLRPMLVARRRTMFLIFDNY